MRVAFRLNAGVQWAGGIHYLESLFSALAELPGRPVEPVLFTGPDVEAYALETLLPFLPTQPVKSGIWTRGGPAGVQRMVGGFLFQKDYLAEKAFRGHGIDLVFQNSAWYGFRFGLPTLAWIADFQHRHLPHLFSRANYWKRDIGYRGLSRCATRIMLSSEAARQDCERYYPFSRGRTATLNFSVRIGAEARQSSPEPIRKKYGLPESFFYMPNQFWIHKNHLAVVEALRRARAKGEDMTIAASGSMYDQRDRQYPRSVVREVERNGLADRFRILGVIPRQDVFPLMRASVAVINPSLFEGWSTTVEEAKSIGVPLLLSDIPVHREQAPDVCCYFDPHRPDDIAGTLAFASREWGPGPHEGLEEAAREKLPRWRSAFARGFLSIAEGTISGR